MSLPNETLRCEDAGYNIQYRGDQLSGNSKLRPSSRESEGKTEQTRQARDEEIKMI